MKFTMVSSEFSKKFQRISMRFNELRVDEEGFSGLEKASLVSKEVY